MGELDIFISNEAKEFLRERFVPTKLPHREKQHQEITALAINDIDGAEERNLLCYGGVGVGKTVTTNSAFKGVDAYATAKGRPFVYVYLKANKFNRLTSIYAEIANQVAGSEQVPHMGLSKGDTYRRMCDCIERKGAAVFVIIDEIDLLYKAFGNDAFYDLTRTNPDLKKSKFFFGGITNDASFIKETMQSVQTRFRLTGIHFPNYTAPELIGIAAPRIEQALHPDVIDEHVVAMFAQYVVAHGGSARFMLELLETAGNLAVKMNHPKIEIDVVAPTIKAVEQEYVREIVGAMNDHQIAALYVIAKETQRVRSEGKSNTSCITTHIAYEGYTSFANEAKLESPRSARQYNNYLSSFVSEGVVEIKERPLGRAKGTEREIMLKDRPEDIVEITKDVLSKRLHSA